MVAVRSSESTSLIQTEPMAAATGLGLGACEETPTIVAQLLDSRLTQRQQ